MKGSLARKVAGSSLALVAALFLGMGVAFLHDNAAEPASASASGRIVYYYDFETGDDLTADTPLYLYPEASGLGSGTGYVTENPLSGKRSYVFSERDGIEWATCFDITPSEMRLTQGKSYVFRMKYRPEELEEIYFDCTQMDPEAKFSINSQGAMLDNTAFPIENVHVAQGGVV